MQRRNKESAEIFTFSFPQNDSPWCETETKMKTMHKVQGRLRKESKAWIASLSIKLKNLWSLKMCCRNISRLLEQWKLRAFRRKRKCPRNGFWLKCSETLSLCKFLRNFMSNFLKTNRGAYHINSAVKIAQMCFIESLGENWVAKKATDGGDNVLNRQSSEKRCRMEQRRSKA